MFEKYVLKPLVTAYFSFIDYHLSFLKITELKEVIKLFKMGVKSSKPLIFFYILYVILLTAMKIVLKRI